MKKFIAVSLMLFVVLGGCAKTRYTRQLNHQNLEAARVIQVKSFNPVVKAIAKDVEANSNELQEWHGAPKEPKEYSAENSAQIRAESKAAREMPWYKRILSFFKLLLGVLPMEELLVLVSGFAPWIGTAVGFLTAGVSLWKKWKSDAKVVAGYEAANGIFNSIRNGEALSVAGAKKIFQDAQAIRNVGPDVLADLKRLWANGDLKKVDEVLGGPNVALPVPPSTPPA